MTQPEHDTEDKYVPQTAQEVERLRRLALAIDAGETRDTQECRRVRQLLPRLAEAGYTGFHTVSNGVSAAC